MIPPGQRSIPAAGGLFQEMLLISTVPGVVGVGQILIEDPVEKERRRGKMVPAVKGLGIAAGFDSEESLRKFGTRAHEQAQDIELSLQVIDGTYDRNPEQEAIGAKIGQAIAIAVLELQRLIGDEDLEGSVPRTEQTDLAFAERLEAAIEKLAGLNTELGNASGEDRFNDLGRFAGMGADFKRAASRTLTGQIPEEELSRILGNTGEDVRNSAVWLVDANISGFHPVIVGARLAFANAVVGPH